MRGSHPDPRTTSARRPSVPPGEVKAVARGQFGGLPRRRQRAERKDQAQPGPRIAGRGAQRLTEVTPHHPRTVKPEAAPPGGQRVDHEQPAPALGEARTQPPARGNTPAPRTPPPPGN